MFACAQPSALTKHWFMQKPSAVPRTDLERAHDKLVVVASEASHAKRGHVGLNDRDPELAAEIISLSARP